MLNKTVAVALSGGVDSSVAASLLLKDGFSVIGVTMLVCPVSFINGNGEPYSPGIAEIESLISNFVKRDSGEHTQQESENEQAFPPELFLPPLNSLTDAALICRHLGIPHHILDLRESFNETIIDYFAGEYYAGRTPNPCVQCNPEIKFGRLMDYAMELGADFFATGHYARIKKDETTGMIQLLRGTDDTKDQAYALFRLTGDRLSRVLFPLGEMTKQTVRKLAAELNLPVMEKPESQEICFIPDDDYIGFLRARYSGLEKPGEIVHVNGETMGRHKGLMHYTIGQRRRLGIAHPKPLYVVQIDAANNRLVVGYWEDLFLREAIVGNLHFISGHKPKKQRIMTKIRYNQAQVPATLEMMDEKTARIRFDEPVRAVTPGQAAVFYSHPDGEAVLGGGTIVVPENLR